MSKYTGVYILETEGPEFRVAAATSYNSFFNGLDENGRWKPNVDTIYDTFFDKTIYDSYDHALQSAIDLSENLEVDNDSESLYDTGELEDGICHLREFRHLNFYDM